MSTGAKTMQILFIITGLISIALGTLGSMVEGDDRNTAEWTCSVPSQSTPQQFCRATSNNGGEHVATQFILAGIGLQIAAAAVAIGGRRDQAAAPMPYPMPGQPVYPPRPVAPMASGSPAIPAQQAPQPGWPA
jgi:hypothetical protein